MASIFVPDPSLLSNLSAAPASRLPCLLLLSSPGRRPFSVSVATCRGLGMRRSFAVSGAASDTFMANSSKNGVLTVGDFMTRREDLHVVNPTTTVDEAIELLVENRITGFPVIDGDWKLVGLVSDYDLLALDTISGGGGKTDNSMFPEVDSSWKTFNEVQKLLSKTNGQVVGDVMTPAPVVVRETTNLEDVARILLETKYRRLPVVDDSGKLVGIITRGNIIRAALQMKHASEMKI
ncbi:PREDICTED: CBS domain-containing protein CBSX1, chloroplastic [Fragaria vesca subsp. vesca]|uniref:CBS domain-containing protein CBSX1, chloroplastic n=1 Tax=Fragaria vesca subsp. vesca TaxID=101020 RepID=UPI0002C36506|nr:PREDICTED: CBS domain-containing protein CBSX1, chloroplastic [Fragaria vesca subsp. vesca]